MTKKNLAYLEQIAVAERQRVRDKKSLEAVRRFIERDIKKEEREKEREKSGSLGGRRTRRRRSMGMTRRRSRR
jgi:hypothetical protein